MRPHPLLERYYDSESERRRRVREWFDASAPSYDRITQGFSLGSGVHYRRDALRRAGIGPGARVLDVACGTGQLTTAAEHLVGPSGRVVGIDPSSGMLAQARLRTKVPLLQGTAEDLPVASASFDWVTMGYALRHVADLDATFAEYRRVLRPGGRVLLLEITPPRSRVGHWLLRLYLGRIVPFFSRWSGKAAGELMSYYWDTIEQVVPPETIIDRLTAAGFTEAGRFVSAGLFSEYSGRVPAPDDQEA